MIFNGIEKEYLAVLRGLNRPAWAPVERGLITVPGMPGAHLSHSKRQVRTITVPVFLLAENISDLQKLKEDLAEWLIHDEAKKLKFKDEPDRIYYALVDGALDLDELVKWGKGIITFICPDPYKYGPEQEYDITDNDVIENKGTADANPIIELTAKEKTTFALISLGADEDSKYNIIGTPADDDVVAVDTKEPVIKEDGSTIDTWDKPSMDMIDDPNVSNIGGNLGYDDAGIRPNPYGPSGSGQRGGAATKELSSPVQDFELETSFDIISRREIENWRMMIYLHDENLNPIGQIGLKDNSRVYKRRVPLATAGPHKTGYNRGRVLGDKSDYNDRARDVTLYYLRMKREGNKFSFFVGEWQNFRYINEWEGSFIDNDGKFAGKLKHVTLFMGSYQDRPIPSRIRMNYVDIYELSHAVEDQTPYIVYPGDTITFDHKDDDILLNGEARNDLKNFGASFFTLKKGYNNVIVTPSDTFDTKVAFRDKYL